MAAAKISVVDLRTSSCLEMSNMPGHRYCCSVILDCSRHEKWKKGSIAVFLLVTRLENVNSSDKETQIDHVSMLKEYDLIRYQQQHPDQFRPYGKLHRDLCFFLYTLIVRFLSTQSKCNGFERTQRPCPIRDTVPCHVDVEKVNDIAMTPSLRKIAISSHTEMLPCQHPFAK